MSRFKLYALAQMMLSSITGNKKLTEDERNKEVTDLNRKTGGLLFTSPTSHIPTKFPNQRQKRKLRRQMA